MFKVTREELGEDADLLEYLSDSTNEGDETEEYISKKCNAIEEPLTLSDSFSKSFVVFGLPCIGSDKYERFLKALRTIINQTLKMMRVEYDEGFSLDVPRDEAGNTKGIAILTFSSSFQAETVCQALSKAPFDKQTRFNTMMFDDVRKFIEQDESVPGHFETLYPPPTLFNRSDLRNWLMSSRCKEQFVIRYQSATEIYSFDSIQRIPELIYDGERAKGGKRVWTDFSVQWSPMGSYLVTFHRQGVVLWGGDNWDKKVRFEHKDVKFIDFSPNEEYLLTWDGSSPDSRFDKAVKVWHVLSGRLLRCFSTPNVILNRGGSENGRHFIWSSTGNYIAHCSDKGELFVYESSTMTLVEDPTTGAKNPLKYPLQFFDWSPEEDNLSIWCPERGDTPGRLTLLSIKSRKELAIKNVFNVREASVHWQPKGQYMCLKALVSRRAGKKAKKEYTQLEIFRVKEKNVPVDTVHVEGVTVKCLSWESSNRFAIVVVDDVTRSQTIRFYQVNSTQTDFVCSYHLTSPVDTIKWSPSGGYFVLGGSGGNLTFCQLTAENKFDILQKDEHFMCNWIQWDPTGRYVTTAFQSKLAEGAYKYSTETGFIIWSFQGRRLYNSPLETFYQFIWRPHPPSLIPREKLEEIPRRLKDYSKKFDVEDEAIRSEKRNVVLQKRKVNEDEFNAVLDKIYQWKVQQPLYKEWLAAKEALLESLQWEEQEEVIEIELETIQEVISTEV
ncbi:putative eukaryotic translation initiation factor [Cryptosporidium felis]|nr:putative eukaryotic translation initiation factor [Cryptosporidium felis]